MTARLSPIACSLLAPAFALAQASAPAPHDPPALDAAWIVAGAAILVSMIVLLVGPGVLGLVRSHAAAAHRRVREGT